MDDWDQLTDLGDCGALCGMTILDLQPPLILDLLWDAAQAMLDLLMDWMGANRVTLDPYRP
ncbi:hypothetical protein ACXYTP_24740 [Tsukamurella ocularis]